jgi:metallo-beta-lactamase class B
MKRFRLSLLLTFLSLSQFAFAQLDIKHLTGDTYIFTTYKTYQGELVPANDMYVVTSQGIVLLDMPWDTKQVFPLLDSIEQRHHQKVVMSISTHFHDDRTGAIDLLKSRGVKTWSSKFTLDLCRIHKEKEAEYYFVKDTTFTVGNYSFEAYYPGKGHAPDNIVVWVPQSKILYGGCFVKSTESSGLGNMSDANVQEWETSVQKVMKKYPSPAYIIPGHMSWQSKKSLTHTLKLIREALKK